MRKCVKHESGELNQYYMEIIDASLQAAQCSLSTLKQRATSRKSVPVGQMMLQKNIKRQFLANVWEENNNASGG